MKRSNRLVLLIGVFLAIVAFVGVVLLFNGSGSNPGQATSSIPPTTAAFVKVDDIPIGTVITTDMVETRQIPAGALLPGAIRDIRQITGHTIRIDAPKDTQLTEGYFLINGQPADITPNIPQGLRAMAVQVDQTSGVGTLIHTGDHVDMVIGFTGEKFPVITTDPKNPGQITVVTGLNNSTVKLIIQDLQVIGTLLPPPPAQTQQAAAGASPEPQQQQGTALNGQQEIVILAVTPHQAEAIKFSQMDAVLTLILRSPKDYIDPVTKQPIVPPLDKTATGVTLRVMVDQFGVLPPELIQAILPKGFKP